MDQTTNQLIRDQLEKVLTSSPRFELGVDTTTNKQYAYCLIMLCDGQLPSVILSKVITDKEKFNKEVLSIKNIFNAVLRIDQCYYI